MILGYSPGSYSRSASCTITYGLRRLGESAAQRSALALIARLGQHPQARVGVRAENFERSVVGSVVDGDDLSDERRVEHSVEDLLDGLLLRCSTGSRRRARRWSTSGGRSRVADHTDRSGPLRSSRSRADHVESEAERHADVGGVERDEADRAGHAFGGGEVDRVAQPDRLGARQRRCSIEAALVDRARRGGDPSTSRTASSRSRRRIALIGQPVDRRQRFGQRHRRGRPHRVARRALRA